MPSPLVQTERDLAGLQYVQELVYIDASRFLVHEGGHRVVVNLDLSRKAYSEAENSQVFRLKDDVFSCRELKPPGF